MRNQSPNQSPAPGSRRPRTRPWLAIGIAAVALISIVSAELWAIRRVPPVDNPASATVASELDRVLARVAAASLPIGPMN
jgi:hypothetical protein